MKPANFGGVGLQLSSTGGNVLSINNKSFEWLGSDEGNCLSLGMEGSIINAEEFLNSLNLNYNYYLVKGNVSFRTEDENPLSRIDIGLKRAELDIELKNGIVKGCFPSKEEEILEEDIEYDYGVSLSADGNVDFLPLKTGIKSELDYKKLIKTKSRTINTYCYSSGGLTPSPKWIFELRKGETHLEAAREILFVVELPRDQIFSGEAKLFQRDIILLNSDHKELSGLESMVEKARRLCNNIKGLILKEIKPARISFPVIAGTRASKPRLSPQVLSNETVSTIEELLDQAENEGLI